MALMRRAPAMGVALALLVAGCDGSGPSDGEASGQGNHGTPLTELEGLPAAGDPTAEAAGPVKVLSELQYGRSRLTAYVTAGSCGFIAAPTAPKDDPAAPPRGGRLHLVSSWPAEGEGGDMYPVGPYNSASGGGAPKTWASVSCSKGAMVVEYVAGETGAPEHVRGHATVTRTAPATLRIIVGDRATRQQIVDRAKR
ncbi:hypothetical protein [Streptomyces sp. NPDC054987]